MTKYDFFLPNRMMLSVFLFFIINLNLNIMSNFNYDEEERYYAKFVEESANDDKEQPRPPDEDELANMCVYQRRKYLKKPLI